MKARSILLLLGVSGMAYADFNYSFLSITPGNLEPGKSGGISFTVKNTGTSTWNVNKVRLVTSISPTGLSMPTTSNGAGVLQYGQYTFMPVTTPTTRGTFTLTMRL